MSKQKIGRLAMRQEGNQWVAYYALNETMEDAIWLGAIRMGAVLNPERKTQFMNLMRDIVADILEEMTGTRPIWGGPEPAPEHEKAGSA